MLNKIVIALSVSLLLVGVLGCDQVKGLLSDAARGKAPFSASNASVASAASAASSAASQAKESPDVIKARKMAGNGDAHKRLCATFAQRLSLVNERLSYSGNKEWDVKKLHAKKVEIQADAKESGC